MRLKGKTALVTGAASGIGRAVAEEFAREGATVLSADIDERAAIRLDVSNESNWENVLAGIPHLDVFVASAGISHARPIAEMTLEEWRRVMAVNLDSMFLGVRAVSRVMHEGGSMVLISSSSGIKAAAGASAYSTSKAAVHMFAKVAALELKDRGIRVNTVSPAGVATPMWTKMPFWDDLVAKHGSEQAAWNSLGGADPATPPLKRMAMPLEIARAVMFLASSDSAGMTGADLVIDAGYTL